MIAIGGGSPMDVAKAIAVLASGGGVLSDWKVPALCSMPVLPLICIPTTAGTGSEVSRFTVVIDTSRDPEEKMLIMGSACMPVAAVVDYELPLCQPPLQTADTGLDALTHALECYVSAKANPTSDALALSALGQIYPNLRRAYTTPSDHSAREAVMLGATQAGMAFSNASVALVHGMSRPVGAFFHVPHGLSNAMLLPSVTAFSLSAAPQRYATAARAMGCAAATDTDADAGTLLIQALRALNADLAVPSPQEYGIDRTAWMERMSVMAEQALASGSPANNPRVPTIAEMIEIYTALYA
jgi:alcohol dehydrogenase class IV